MERSGLNTIVKTSFEDEDTDLDVDNNILDPISTVHNTTVNGDALNDLIRGHNN